MELKLLAGGDPQAAVADRLRQLVTRQILLGRKAPAHDPHSNHELERFFLAFLLERTAKVAVVLLVGAVEFQDRRGVFAEMRLAVFELVGHEGLQISARQLRQLDLARLGAGRVVGGLHRRLLPSFRVRRLAVSARRISVPRITRRAWVRPERRPARQERRSAYRETRHPCGRRRSFSSGQPLRGHDRGS